MEVNQILPPSGIKLYDGLVVVGMDPSSYRNCGWGVMKYQNNKVELLRKFTQVFEVDTTREDPWNDLKRFRELYDNLYKMVKEFDAKVLCLERSMGGGLTFVRGNLGETVGVAKLVCCDLNIKVFETSPAHLKKQITGHGRAGKTHIKNNIASFFNLDKKGVEHECDAVACGLSFFIDSGWNGYVISQVASIKPKTKKKKEKKSKKVPKVNKLDISNIDMQTIE